MYLGYNWFAQSVDPLFSSPLNIICIRKADSLLITIFARIKIYQNELYKGE